MNYSLSSAIGQGLCSLTNLIMHNYSHTSYVLSTFNVIFNMMNIDIANTGLRACAYEIGTWL